MSPIERSTFLTCAICSHINVTWMQPEHSTLHCAWLVSSVFFQRSYYSVSQRNCSIPVHCHLHVERAVLSILIVASSIGFVSNLLGTTLVAAGHSKMPLLINLVDAAVNVASNMILIPIFGITGAAIFRSSESCCYQPSDCRGFEKKGNRCTHESVHRAHPDIYFSVRFGRHISF